MSNNFSNFEDEFNKISQISKDTSGDTCDLDGCTTDDAALGTYEEVINTMIMPPIKSGVYFSRLDIKRVAYMFGESIIIDERKKMIKQLLNYVDSKENLEKFAKVMCDAIEAKIEIYRELSDKFTATSYQFEDYIRKARGSIEILNRVVKEYE